MQMKHLINQLMVKSRVFQETFIQEKNHPTLKTFMESPKRGDELDQYKRWPISRNCYDTDTQRFN